MPTAAKTDYVYDPNDPGNSPANPKPDEPLEEGNHPTDNPDGVTVSSDDYVPKTQEEKATLLGVEMVDPIEIEPNEPYPDEEPPPDARQTVLDLAHTKQEQIEAKDAEAQHIANLRAGGLIAGGAPL